MYSAWLHTVFFLRGHSPIVAFSLQILENHSVPLYVIGVMPTRTPLRRIDGVSTAGWIVCWAQATA